LAERYLSLVSKNTSICNIFNLEGKLNMARQYNHNQSPLVKIVYSKVIVQGKVELVPMELYADGSLKPSR
jgi:hypothetical protein